MKDLDYMKRAIEVSQESCNQGGFPVGAVIVKNDVIISEGISDGKRKCDATSHAEIAAIRTAEEKLKVRDLSGATIYSSLEPCLMCFSACYWAHIDRIVFACPKNKVSKQHYEGLYDLQDINAHNNRQIELVYLSDLAASAQQIIESWETSKRSAAQPS